MRAAIFKGAGEGLEIEVIEDPVPGPGEAVIRVSRCGVCGSDIHMTSEHSNFYPAGTVLGHEFAGEVVAVGKGSERVKVGDRVTAMPATGCGACEACVAGYPLACSAMQGMVGGFGEYMRIADSSALVLPASLSMVDGALVEPLAVGLRGATLAEIKPGSTVVSLGAGSVGLAAIFWARQLGAGKIVAMSRSNRREGPALAMGADGFVAFADDEAERLADALGGPPEVVLECAGVPGMMQKAVDLVRPGGTIVSLGFCGQPDPFVPALATWKRVTLKFSFAYDLGQFEHAAETLDRGHVEPRDMVTKTVSLDAFPQMFEAIRNGADETKVHLDPWADH